MSDEPDADEPDAEYESTPLAAQSTKRWQREWLRGHGRGFRMAAFVVVLAGAVVLIALVFWFGFLGGASNGHHHHHGGPVTRAVGDLEVELNRTSENPLRWAVPRTVWRPSLGPRTGKSEVLVRFGAQGDSGYTHVVSPERYCR